MKNNETAKMVVHYVWFEDGAKMCERDTRKSVCVCVCVNERDVCVCVCVNERDMCVCEKERERCVCQRV